MNFFLTSSSTSVTQLLERVLGSRRVQAPSREEAKLKRGAGAPSPSTSSAHGPRVLRSAGSNRIGTLLSHLEFIIGHGCVPRQVNARIFNHLTYALEAEVVGEVEQLVELERAWMAALPLDTRQVRSKEQYSPLAPRLGTHFVRIAHVEPREVLIALRQISRSLGIAITDACLTFRPGRLSAARSARVWRGEAELLIDVADAAGRARVRLLRQWATQTGWEVRIVALRPDDGPDAIPVCRVPAVPQPPRAANVTRAREEALAHAEEARGPTVGTWLGEADVVNFPGGCDVV